MNKNILVIKGHSRYNVLRIAADYVASSFEKLGYNVTVTDLLLQEERDGFASLITNKYDLVYSFQALLYDICSAGDNTSDFSAFTDKLFFGHIVDHPIYHDCRLNIQHGDNMFVGFIDRNHVEFTKQYYKGVKNVSYLSHGGVIAQNLVSFKDREIEVLFPSSYEDPFVVLNELNNMEDVYKGISNILIELMLKDSLMTLQDALILYFKSINFQYTDDEFILMIHQFLGVDQYIRAYTRDLLIKELLRNGINITVCGAGWENFEADFKSNLKIYGEHGLDLEEVTELMGNSKFVLNHVPTFQNGMHERIYTSMRCGAICITNDFPIVHEEFTDGEDIILYSYNGGKELANRMKELLVNLDKGEMIATQGKIIADASHKWEDNALKILKLVGLEK